MVIPRQKIKVFTKTAGSYDANGVYAETQSESFIYASIQPTSPDDINSLPEGRRQSKTYTLFTSSALRGIQDANQEQVEIDDERYEIVKVQKWSNNILNHYMAIVTRLEDQPTVEAI